LSKPSKDLKQKVLGLKQYNSPVLGTKYFQLPWDLSPIFCLKVEVQEVIFPTKYVSAHLDFIYPSKSVF